MSPLKSLISQRPPSIRLTSTPFDSDGGLPGSMNDLTAQSQVPSRSLSSSCSLVGFGIGGGPPSFFLSCARRALPDSSTRTVPRRTRKSTCTDRMLSHPFHVVDPSCRRRVRTTDPQACQPSCFYVPEPVKSML